MTAGGGTSASAGAAAMDGRRIQGTLAPLARAGATVRVEVVFGGEHRP
jgi:hypothetical protein